MEKTPLSDVPCTELGNRRNSKNIIMRTEQNRNPGKPALGKRPWGRPGRAVRNRWSMWIKPHIDFNKSLRIGQGNLK
jgi:hypothetical protein